MSVAESLWLAIRSLLWTLLLPGLFAGLLPWRYFGLSQVVADTRSPRQWFGLAAIGIGVVLLGICIWECSPRAGHARTRGPAENPRGPGSPAYWAVWFLAINLFVIGYEEPTLQRRFGPAYERYRASVGRWVPRRPARTN